MEKKYNSVLEMISDVSDDKDFNESLEKEIKGKQISKALLVMRCKRGLTQTQLAGKTKFSQGKISKIENSFDTDLSTKDLITYCSALDIHIEIGFSDRRMTMADRVKYHYFKLKNLLEEMRNLANGDKAIEEGVKKFTSEAFVNISSGLLDCLCKIHFKEEKRGLIHVSTPIEFGDFNENLKNKNRELVA